MGVKFSTAAAALFLWASAGHADTFRADDTYVVQAQLELGRPAAWQIGSVVVPQQFDITPSALANGRPIADGASRSVPVSGNVLFLGTALMMLAWFGLRHSSRRV